jgi:hypothetical protein
MFNHDLDTPSLSWFCYFLILCSESSTLLTNAFYCIDLKLSSSLLRAHVTSISIVSSTSSYQYTKLIQPTIWNLLIWFQFMDLSITLDSKYNSLLLHIRHLVKQLILTLTTLTKIPNTIITVIMVSISSNNHRFKQVIRFLSYNNTMSLLLDILIFIPYDNSKLICCYYTNRYSRTHHMLLQSCTKIFSKHIVLSNYNHHMIVLYGISSPKITIFINTYNII